MRIPTTVVATISWAAALGLVPTACTTGWNAGAPEPYPVYESPAQSPAMSAFADDLFRLVAPGENGVRAGWLIRRGAYWIAVDTVALAPRREYPTSTWRDGPYTVRVDSGPVSRSAAGDTLLFLSSAQVLPMAGAVGVLNRDTLTVRAAPPDRLGQFEWARVRIYVRVRERW